MFAEKRLQRCDWGDHVKTHIIRTLLAHISMYRKILVFMWSSKSSRSRTFFSDASYRSFAVELQSKQRRRIPASQSQRWHLLFFENEPSLEKLSLEQVAVTWPTHRLLYRNSLFTAKISVTLKLTSRCFLAYRWNRNSRLHNIPARDQSTS